MCSVDQSCLTLCDPMEVVHSLLWPWNFPGKNSGIGCHFLLQGIFLSQESKLCLLHPLHWQADSLPLHLLTKSEFKGKPWSLGVYDGCVHSSLVKVLPFCWVILIVRKAMHVWEQRVTGKSLYLLVSVTDTELSVSVNFAMNIQLL